VCRVFSWHTGWVFSPGFQMMTRFSGGLPTPGLFCSLVKSMFQKGFTNYRQGEFTVTADTVFDQVIRSAPVSALKTVNRRGSLTIWWRLIKACMKWGMPIPLKHGPKAVLPGGFMVSPWGVFFWGVDVHPRVECIQNCPCCALRSICSQKGLI
jgi:hypothetical protein